MALAMPMPYESFVIGLDLGTSGLRALAVTASGDVIASCARPITPVTFGQGVHEQDPSEWWMALVDASREIHARVKPAKPAAIAVTSTSGSLVVTDGSGTPLRPAILYDDTRSATVADLLNNKSGASGWNASHSLTKALFIRHHEPATWHRVSHLLHPADWIIGKLTGRFGISDASNALKLGYDGQTSTWDPVIARIDVPASLFPQVIPVGSCAGTVTAGAAAETLFAQGAPVIPAGTDGLASLVASGAVKAGDANTTLGTTVVWKVLSENRPACTFLYSHRHPSGLWAPGAASSAGPGCLEQTAPEEMEALNRQAAALLPTSLLCYPLRGCGERFPFCSADARGFVEGQTDSPVEMRAAILQGLAFLERWGYERISAAGVAVGSRVFSTGGAAHSDVLSCVRAEVLDRTLIRCCHPEAAFGAGILAATHAYFHGAVSDAIATMCRTATVFQPAPARRFEHLYYKFLRCCAKRGYVQ